MSFDLEEPEGCRGPAKRIEDFIKQAREHAISGRPDKALATLALADIVPTPTLTAADDYCREYEHQTIRLARARCKVSDASTRYESLIARNVNSPEDAAAYQDELKHLANARHVVSCRTQSVFTCRGTDIEDWCVAQARGAVQVELPRTDCTATLDTGADISVPAESQSMQCPGAEPVSPVKEPEKTSPDPRRLTKGGEAWMAITFAGAAISGVICGIAYVLSVDPIEKTLGIDHAVRIGRRSCLAGATLVTLPGLAHRYSLALSIPAFGLLTTADVLVPRYQHVGGEARRRGAIAAASIGAALGIAGFITAFVIDQNANSEVTGIQVDIGPRRAGLSWGRAF